MLLRKQAQRHRVYKMLRQRWFASCGICYLGAPSTSWRGAMNLLEFHVKEFHGPHGRGLTAGVWVRQA